MDNNTAASGTKKKFVRKVAPSKAPGRVLKKQLRNMERLLKNKDTLKDLPIEVVAETEKKIADVKKKIEALGPQAKPTAPAPAVVSSTKSSKTDAGNSASKGGIKATELRRAGRKIVAFKKQHPNYTTSEAESTELVELELDLMYIKYYPKGQEYIPIYTESVTEVQVKARTEIRENTRKALESGELKKSTGVEKSEEKTKSVIGKHPASNWSDDEEEEEEEEEEERENKKLKTE
ncbi:hypothetical protein BGZ95_006388 [Linnemannia exigua]|uniref:rRNA-processing protein EFG1 n=1 Tax=Linnemannia exigua TaxID=604196 RepID=A0AAD4H7B6_9FUNG|nr:hypothetical protein BGZ95_006388 [Linnemannia exigua]